MDYDFAFCILNFELEEMSDPIHIVTVIVAMKYRGKYLLVQRNKDEEIFPSHWQNLGGKVEIGERIEEAVRREVFEEIGFRLKKKTQLTFLQSYSWEKGKDEVRRLGVIFLIKLDKKPRRIRLNGEAQNYGYFTFREAKNLQTIGMTSPTGTMAQLKVAEKLD